MFKPDAQEILDDLSAAVARLYQENAILRSQLKTAERAVAEVAKQQSEEKPKAVA